MVNEEALQSVLKASPPEAPESILDDSALVILINGEWVPEELAAYDSPPEDDYGPIEGCTLEDVGWMIVHYDRAEMEACVQMCYG